MADVLHVACAVEGDYVPHTAAMLDSVMVQANGSAVHVHYLHGGDVSTRDATRLERMLGERGASVEFIVVDDARVEGLPTHDFTRKATWYRLLLPELLAGVDRVLYLDADVIVVDDLRPLWTTDLTGHYLAAVTNVFPPAYLHRPAELGLAGPEVYFNAGVLLMNLAAMRADDCSERLVAYGVKHAPDLLWRDQDVLNVVLGERRLPLHPRWNCMNAILLFDWADEVFDAAALAEARANPAIRHFEGPDQNKPWHYGCEAAARELYMRHRRATPWPRLRPSGRTVRTLYTGARRRLSRSGGCRREA
jgi:lipopolysaccharide biosynthesis glycosyltransferase